MTSFWVLQPYCKCKLEKSRT